MKGNQLISNNIKFKVKSCLFDGLKSRELCFACRMALVQLFRLLGRIQVRDKHLLQYKVFKNSISFHSLGDGRDKSGLHS